MSTTWDRRLSRAGAEVTEEEGRETQRDFGSAEGRVIRETRGLLLWRSDRE